MSGHSFDPSEAQTISMNGKVGILFAYQRRLLIDTTPAESAEDYGRLKTHPIDHPDFWEQLQQQSVVPSDVEYLAVPRGRVTFDTQKLMYFVFLDRCIRRQPRLVLQVMDQFILQGSNVEIRSDSHYRCPGCMHP